MPAPNSRAPRNSGFTLIEALVAFVVLATLLSTMLQGVVQSRAGASVYARHLRNEMLLRTLVDQIETRRDLKASTYRGTIDGHRWTARVAASDIGLSRRTASSKTLAPPTPVPGTPTKPERIDWRLFKIELRVEDGDRRLLYTTLQAMKPSPQDPDR